jgi:general nucleoside transport system permease protein
VSETNLEVAVDTRAPRTRALPSGAVVLLVLVGGLVLLSAVRVATGANDILSSGTINASIGLGVPIAMAGLGGLWAERAGVVNIGLEGMMILGTWGAGFAGYQWGAWAGVVAAVLCGAAGGLLHAIATVGFGVDHIVSGVALNILGLATARFLADNTFTGVPGGGPTQSPPIGDLPAYTVPGLSGALGTLEARHWFIVSDVAAVLRALVHQMSWLTVIAVGLLVLTWWLFWRTGFGLRLRSCGESPQAAESLGVNVYRYKYIAVVVSGGFAGLGGAFLAIVASSAYREGQTGGRGFIGLAAMIFGNWRPGGLAAGAGLFGYTDALQLRSGGASVHALLLVVGLVLVAVGGWQLVRRRLGRGVAALVFGAVALVWFAVSRQVPEDLTSMTPYVATLLVLSLASQRLRMPAADGQTYRRGESR